MELAGQTSPGRAGSRVADAQHSPAAVQAGWLPIVGTAVTFFAVAQMLQPVLNATQALDRYTAEGTRPRLPLGFRDEAGRLMASVQRTLLQLDKKIGELSYTAITDPLTGVRNRRWLEDVGVRAIEKAMALRQEFGLLVIDVDEFKQLNDTHGHVFGDRVLAAIARGLQEAVRSTDEIVRIGGDEFCIFLPTADGQAVAAAAERVRDTVEQALLKLPMQTSVTLSVGGTTLLPNDTTFDCLYQRADMRLYTAKGSGRDQAVCA